MSPRTTSRFLARFLVGVLLFAQLAVAAYACQVIPNGSASGPDHSAVMGIGDVAAVQTSGMEPILGGTDSEFPNLCLGHCQFGQQNADDASTPTAPVALLTNLYALPSMEQSADLARPIASGHPAPGSDLTNPFGLIKSGNGGKSWKQLGLEGESDFHLLATSYTTNDVYVLNHGPNSRMSKPGTITRRTMASNGRGLR